MNIVTLINKLEKQKQNIEAALSVLRAETETPVTAKKILNGVKKNKWSKAQRAKFAATMKRKFNHES